MKENYIGKQIKKFRVMKGLTQADLANALAKRLDKNVAPSAIAGYESGQRVPKVEVRNQIAAILKIDPIELSGIELTEIDEKRLLCKLLVKYATSIDLEEDGSVTVGLTDDFAGFQMEYEDNRGRLEGLIEGVPEDSLEYELKKQDADSELGYWLDMYPAYDPAYLTKDRKKDYELKDIVSMRRFVESELRREFFKFQDSYLTPLINQEIISKLRKQKGE